MIYRVAIWTDQTSMWNWKSTVLSTPDTLFSFLKIYDRVTKNRLRVFFATSTEFLNEMLVRANQRLASNSVTAEEFLQCGRQINVQQIKQFELELGLQAHKELVTKSVITGQLRDERSPLHANSMVEPANHAFAGASLTSRETRPLERLQEEPEKSRGGDHDTPYIFTLPSSIRETLAWTRLLAKVHRGELEP